MPGAVYRCPECGALGRVGEDHACLVRLHTSVIEELGLRDEERRAGFAPGSPFGEWAAVEELRRELDAWGS